MNTLLNRMDWRCTQCGERPGCKCWVKLKCKCGRSTSTLRTPEFFDLDEVETACPLCRSSQHKSAAAGDALRKGESK
jgi:hypothetical protein